MDGGERDEPAGLYRRMPRPFLIFDVFQTNVSSLCRTVSPMCPFSGAALAASQPCRHIAEFYRRLRTYLVLRLRYRGPPPVYTSRRRRRRRRGESFQIQPINP